MNLCQLTIAEPQRCRARHSGIPHGLQATSKSARQNRTPFRAYPPGMPFLWLIFVCEYVSWCFLCFGFYVSMQVRGTTCMCISMYMYACMYV